MEWAPRGRPVPPVSVWDEFAAGVRARDRRPGLPEHARTSAGSATRARPTRSIEDLGADRLHVRRGRARLPPADAVRTGRSGSRATSAASYDAWLRELLEGDAVPGGAPELLDLPRRGVHGVALARRACRRSGSRSSSPTTPTGTLLPRTFEQLLGLPTGPADARGVHQRLAEHERGRGAAPASTRSSSSAAGPTATTRGLVQQGMVARAPAGAGPSAGDVPVPPLPAWARPLVAARSLARVEVIERLGIDVVGDPACLLLPERPAAAEADLAPDRVSRRTPPPVAVSGGASRPRLEREQAHAQRSWKCATSPAPPRRPWPTRPGRRLRARALAPADRRAGAGLAERWRSGARSRLRHTARRVPAAANRPAYIPEVFHTVWYPHRPSSEGGRRDLNARKPDDPTPRGRGRCRPCRRRARRRAARPRPRDRLRGRRVRRLHASRPRRCCPACRSLKPTAVARSLRRAPADGPRRHARQRRHPARRERRPPRPASTSCTPAAATGSRCWRPPRRSAPARSPCTRR